MTTIERYHEAVRRLDALIESAPAQTDTSRQAVQARADARMGRLCAFLDRMGRPQDGYPIIHIGGTSGKGSTSTTLAAVLHAAGYRVGLHTSPYLQTSSEKLQLDGRLIDPALFVALTDAFFAEHERWIADGHEALTYGEAWSAIFWTFFRETAVDVAVVEVGAGGRFDLTNICAPVLSIITSVGLDHIQTLGDTIAQIAWHKAGIIKAGIPALSTVDSEDARAAMREQADAVDAPLTEVDLARELVDVTTSAAGTSWTSASTGVRHAMSMAGSFQARNGQTVVSAVGLLRQAGFAISDEALSAGLRDARIPGRAEYVRDRCVVLLDGAHNPQKLGALVADLPALLPHPRGRCIGVVGLLDAKAGREMLETLVPHVDVVIATSPQVFGKTSKRADVIVQTAREVGFMGEVEPIVDPMEAIRRALAMAAADDVIVVTGSLYLVGNVRSHWFAEEAIVRQRTPWPVIKKLGDSR